MSEFIEAIETPEGMGMGIIKYRYIGEGPENDALVAEVLARENKAKEARRAIVEEYGADGFVFHDGKPYRIGYKEKQVRPYFKREIKHASGGFSYSPKKSTKEGRALQAKMDDPKVAFDYNRFILDALKCHRIVYNPPSLSMAAAGIVQGKIILSIPGSDNERESDPMPTVPAWLKEVTESEYQKIIQQEADNE